MSDVSQERREEIMRRVRAGQRRIDIARELDVHVQTVYRAIQLADAKDLPPNRCVVCKAILPPPRQRRYCPGCKPTRDARPRRSRPRPETVNVKRLSRKELAIGAEINPPIDTPRPKTRGECVDGPRPCPWVACKHHLYLDVDPKTGSIKLNFPDIEPWEMSQSCSLDLADLAGISLESVGEAINLTRERIRQIESKALKWVKEELEALES